MSIQHAYPGASCFSRWEGGRHAATGAPATTASRARHQHACHAAWGAGSSAAPVASSLARNARHRQGLTPAPEHVPLWCLVAAGASYTIPDLNPMDVDQHADAVKGVLHARCVVACCAAVEHQRFVLHAGAVKERSKLHTRSVPPRPGEPGVAQVAWAHGPLKSRGPMRPRRFDARLLITRARQQRQPGICVSQEVTALPQRAALAAARSGSWAGRS